MGDEDNLPGLRDEFVRKGLRFSHLRLLVALKDTGQISAAAGQIAITQPAGSRLLAELEQLSATKLYDRHARGVTLTEAGEGLARRARAVLSLLDEASLELGEIATGLRGEVRIGAVTGPALELVMPVIREARVTVPEIRISVVVDTSDRLAESLATRTLDFYIGRLHENIDSRAVVMRLIGPEPVNLIVSRTHPLTRRENPTLEDCLAYDWVMQPPGGLQRRTVETYLLAKGYPLPGRVLGTDSLLLSLALISETNAVAPVARSVARFYAQESGLGGNIAILDVAPDLAVVPYSLIRLREPGLSAAAARIHALIEGKIAGMTGQASAILAGPRAGIPPA